MNPVTILSKAMPKPQPKPHPPQQPPAAKTKAPHPQPAAITDASSIISVDSDSRKPSRSRSPKSRRLRAQPSRPLKGIRSFKRSRWIQGSWHKCHPSAWHPPLTLWTRPLVEAQIGPKPSQFVTSTEESCRLFECPCDIPIIKCRKCHLNCCRNCSYRNWHLCWLCAFRRTHPRAHITGIPTLDQFMWDDKYHWFMQAMNDHT
jgi:hypothetical protein